MNEKAGCALAMGAVVFGLVGGIIAVMDPPKSEPAVAEAQQSQLTNPQLRRWRSEYDGVEINCFQSGDGRGFLTNPTNQQMADGAVVIKNTDPSDDAWNEACRSP